VRHKSHGTGRFEPAQLAGCGEGCVFEEGVLVFHPENVFLGKNVYVGHQTILKGYYKNGLHVGDETWIGQQCFFHAAGGLRIGARVGIGPGVRIISSMHRDVGRQTPVLFSPIDLAEVTVGDDADLGVGSVVLPGVSIGRGAIIGAGAVVAESVPDYAVAAGVPARVLRLR
jgi:acetyltransferase-like isoleucine patch superfamily enzyme